MHELVANHAPEQDGYSHDDSESERATPSMARGIIADGDTPVSSGGTPNRNKQLTSTGPLILPPSSNGRPKVWKFMLFILATCVLCVVLQYLQGRPPSQTQGVDSQGRPPLSSGGLNRMSKHPGAMKGEEDFQILYNLKQMDKIPPGSAVATETTTTTLPPPSAADSTKKAPGLFEVSSHGDDEAAVGAGAHTADGPASPPLVQREQQPPYNTFSEFVDRLAFLKSYFNFDNLYNSRSELFKATGFGSSENTGSTHHHHSIPGNSGSPVAAASSFDVADAVLSNKIPEKFSHTLYTAMNIQPANRIKARLSPFTQLGAIFNKEIMRARKKEAELALDHRKQIVRGGTSAVASQFIDTFTVSGDGAASTAEDLKKLDNLMISEEALYARVMFEKRCFGQTKWLESYDEISTLIDKKIRWFQKRDQAKLAKDSEEKSSDESREKSLLPGFNGDQFLAAVSSENKEKSRNTKELISDTLWKKLSKSNVHDWGDMNSDKGVKTFIPLTKDTFLTETGNHLQMSTDALRDPINDGEHGDKKNVDPMTKKRKPPNPNKVAAIGESDFGKPPSVVVMVLSKRENVKERKDFRSAWEAMDINELDRSLDVRMYFVVASSFCPIPPHLRLPEYITPREEAQHTWPDGKDGKDPKKEDGKEKKEDKPKPAHGERYCVPGFEKGIDYTNAEEKDRKGWHSKKEKFDEIQNFSPPEKIGEDRLGKEIQSKDGGESEAYQGHIGKEVNQGNNGMIHDNDLISSSRFVNFSKMTVRMIQNRLINSETDLHPYIM